jgi:hypothetical protein
MPNARTQENDGADLEDGENGEPDLHAPTSSFLAS